MPKIAGFLFCVLLLVGCGSYHPLEGSYPIGSTQRLIEKPFEEVWTNLIRFVTSSGVQIRTIEKASGLLVSDELSFEGKVTYEYSKGRLREPNDWIVCSYKGVAPDKMPVNGNQSRMLEGPTRVVGSFNVHVVPEGKGALVTVNIVNLVATGPKSRFQAKSTGSFEKLLLDALSK